MRGVLSGQLSRRGERDGVQAVRSWQFLCSWRFGATAVPRRPLLDRHQPEQRGRVRREPGGLLQLRGRDGAGAVQPGQPRAQREQHAVHGLCGGQVPERGGKRQLRRVRRGLPVRGGQQRAAAGVVRRGNVSGGGRGLQQRGGLLRLPAWECVLRRRRRPAGVHAWDVCGGASQSGVCALQRWLLPGAWQRDGVH